MNKLANRLRRRDGISNFIEIGPEFVIVAGLDGKGIELQGKRLQRRECGVNRQTAVEKALQVMERICEAIAAAE